MRSLRMLKAFPPGAELFEGAGCRQDVFVPELFPNDLHADRETAFGETGGNGGGRMAGEVRGEGLGESDEGFYGMSVDAVRPPGVAVFRVERR